MVRFNWSIEYEYGLSKEGSCNSWLSAVAAIRDQLDAILKQRQGEDEFNHDAFPFGFVAKIDEIKL